MAHVTLVLCRTPLQEFRYGHRSGRWGTMAMIEGPKIYGVLAGGVAQAAAQIAAAVLAPVTVFAGTPGAAPLQLGGKDFTLVTDGNAVTKSTELDSMERFRADSGHGFYMQTRPQPQKPYKLTMYVSSTVAKLNGSGRCLRVHDHGYLQQGSGGPAGILVHEAPHVGWLIGCISPRPKNNRIPNNEDKTPSHQAMEAIFDAMGGFGAGKEASLIVLDW